MSTPEITTEPKRRTLVGRKRKDDRKPRKSAITGRTAAKRRNKIPKETLDFVCLAIQQGATISRACMVAGIRANTLYDYMSIAKCQLAAGEWDTHEIYFLIECEKAEALKINALRKRIYDQSRYDWRAAECLLKQDDPEWKQNKTPEMRVSKDVDENGKAEVVIKLVMTEPIPEESPYG